MGDRLATRARHLVRQDRPGRDPHEHERDDIEPERRLRHLGCPAHGEDERRDHDDGPCSELCRVSDAATGQKTCHVPEPEIRDHDRRRDDRSLAPVAEEERQDSRHDRRGRDGTSQRCDRIDGEDPVQVRRIEEQDGVRREQQRV